MRLRGETAAGWGVSPRFHWQLSTTWVLWLKEKSLPAVGCFSLVTCKIKAVLCLVLDLVYIARKSLEAGLLLIQYAESRPATQMIVLSTPQ